MTITFSVIWSENLESKTLLRSTNNFLVDLHHISVFLFLLESKVRVDDNEDLLSFQNSDFRKVLEQFHSKLYSSMNAKIKSLNY